MCSVESQVLVTESFEAVFVLFVFPFPPTVLKLLSIFLVEEIDTLEKALVLKGSWTTCVEKAA